MVAFAGLGLAALALVLAAVFDAPILAVVGTAAVLLVGVAAEAWEWRGRGRVWLMLAAGAVVVVAGGVAAKLAG